ncbi:MAG: hypothetical protein J5798_10195 [Spirochaetaceae bacterium]|nr:hypothetical protein [Spirochaetaceae bacterium]
MLNKKFILILVCVFASLFMYAESGTIGFYDSINPHHEYSFNSGGKQNRYRIQMGISHYALYLDAESYNYFQCFPNFEMGISREEGGVRRISPNYSCISIFPEIILKDESLKDGFSIKGKSRSEGGYNYNCYASDWEIYENGLVLDILLIDDIWKDNDLKKPKRVYLELKEDGKYYETENTDKFGNLKKNYSAYDFLDRLIFSYHTPFIYQGYSIFKMQDGKKIESVLISNILYYNATKDGIEFITPYGCGFFDFKTESMSLVPKEKYLGKEFTYTPYSVGNGKLKEKKKIIAEEDFILPDIKVPIREDDLEVYSKAKERDMQQRGQDELLKAELLAQ